MLKDLGLIEFIKATGSSEPVPGGGSIAALSGSIAASLAEMVANLTIGKKKYIDVEEEMIAIQKELDIFKFEFLDLIDKDADSFDQVMKAFKMPKETESEKLERTNAIQSGLKGAALAPLEIAKKALDLMDIIEVIVIKGNTNAVTDGLVSAMMARTASLSAILNVRINLASIKDEKFVKLLKDGIDKIEADVIKKEQKILDLVTL